MKTELIRENLNRGVCILRVSRLDAMNALNTELLQMLYTSLLEIAQDPAVRVLILTGDGEKAFIAGADIQEMKQKSIEDAVQFAQLGHSVGKLLELMAKPTIAAVNGFALGGGAELALACDFILASTSASFAQPEVGLGVIPGFGGTLRLSKFVGLPMAKDLIFSGRRISAEEALRIGLVNRVFPIETFMQDVIEIANSMSQHSSAAVAKAKQLLNEFSESVGLNFKLDAEAQAFGRLFGNYDQREGMSAFLEKRKPNFRGL